MLFYYSEPLCKQTSRCIAPGVPAMRTWRSWQQIVCLPGHSTLRSGKVTVEESGVKHLFGPSAGTSFGGPNNISCH
jgi:hypothetical protein